MNNKALYKKIQENYKTSRSLIVENDCSNARQYLIKCMEIALEIYKSSQDSYERVKLKNLIYFLKDISSTLYDYGINDKVKDAFHISKDELQDTTLYSQGWCEEVFEKNIGAVATINASSNNYGCSGTGFVISTKGYLLTNHHVVSNGGGYYPSIYLEIKGRNCRLEVLESSQQHDVALCSFDPKSIPNIKAVKMIEDYSHLKQGADVLVIGNAFSMGLAPFMGTVKFPHEKRSGDLVYTAPSNPGDSGAPVFNRSGQCVAINKSITTSFVDSNGADINARGLTNATPMDTISRLLKDWLNKNSIIL